VKALQAIVLILLIVILLPLAASCMGLLAVGVGTVQTVNDANDALRATPDPAAIAECTRLRAQYEADHRAWARKMAAAEKREAEAEQDVTDAQTRVDAADGTDAHIAAMERYYFPAMERWQDAKDESAELRFAEPRVPC
jgi:hypothetical protein